jgi:GNAT superfamily N-acetyltransferase
MKYEMSKIEIDPASESDAVEILQIQKLAFHGQGLLYGDFNLPPLVQTLEELIRDFTKHAYLKALYEGKLVGSVRGCAEAGACLISRLIVQPDYQNKGFGKMLMQAIEKKFSTVERYELFTGHKSEKNLALYTSLGYRECDRKRQSDRVIHICMRKWNDGRRV